MAQTVRPTVRTHGTPRVYFLDSAPIYTKTDWDPRRRHLYGDDVVYLGTAAPDRPTECTVNVGPLWRGRDWQRFALADRQLVERVRNVLSQDGRALLVIGEHHLALPFCDSGVPFAFDPIDSKALFYWRRIGPMLLSSPLRALNSLRLALHYRRLERRLLRESACFVTAGPADERYLKRLAPNAEVLRIDNGTEMIRLPPVDAANDGRTIGFHGNMTWQPNVETATRLSGPIAAALSRLPGPPLRIRLAGRPTPAQVQARDGINGVEVDGYVEDIRDWLGTLTLYVMPMYLGAGVKNKLIEAMAAGIPVLTNARGAEALPPEGRAAIAIAEGDAGIARTIRALLDRPEELARMRRAGRAYAERHFDWAQHRRQFHAELIRLRHEGRL